MCVAARPPDRVNPSKYTKQRKKCDDAYTKMFGEPECEPKKGGFTRKKSGKISDLPIKCLHSRCAEIHLFGVNLIKLGIRYSS
jgi:hypothetical protein